MANIKLTAGERYTFGRIQNNSVITDSTDNAQSPKYIRNDLYVTSSTPILYVKGGGASGNSVVYVETQGSGNPYTQYSVGSSTSNKWVVGIDNDDDSFKINNGPSIGSPTTLAMSIDTNENTSFAGNVTITGSVTLPGLNSTQTSYGLYYNTATKQVSYGLAASGSGTGSVSSSYATTASYAVTASYYRETDPIFTAKSASFATTASNNFIGTQSIAGNVIIGATTFITSSTTTPKLQLSDGASGVSSMPVTSTPLVVESNSTTTLAIFSPNASTSQIQFGTPADEFGALLRWDYPNRNLILSTATNNSSGKIILQTGTGNEVARFTDTTITLSGSIQVSGSITSSLFGTASWAQNAVSASYFSGSISNAIYAETASYVANITSPSIQTSGSTLYSTNPSTSNFNTTNSIFLGESAGQSATNARDAFFVGQYAGQFATNPGSSIFIGRNAGYFSINSMFSVFLGLSAGANALNSGYSNFIGLNSGINTISASYSTFLGYNVGASGSIGTVGPNNIIIGTNISLPNNRRDSINIGGIIFGTGSYIGNIGGDPYTGSQANGRIGIGTVTPNATLDVAGNTIITGSVISTLGFTGSLSGTASYAQTAATSSTTTAIEGAWTSYTPIWTTDGGTQPVIGNGTLTGAYKQIGKTVFLRVKLNCGSSTTYGSGAFQFSLPITASTPDGIQFPCSILDNGVHWYQGTVNGTYTGANYKSAIIYPNTSGWSDAVTSTAPFTWGNTDSLQFNGTYECV